MKWNVITLFPEMIDQALQFGVVGQARKKNKIEVNMVTPRTFTADVHKTVDDRPFGGGDGMIMLYQPLKSALESLGEEAGHRVLLSAHGQPWNDRKARQWAEVFGATSTEKPASNITLVCGRYGGVDQRFINECIDEEVSIGDYILSGGELGALVLIDSVVRMLPSVLGNSFSALEDSFAADGLLEAPLFTRPQEIDALKVPRVFLEGDHKKIAQVRRLLAILTTLEKRPDLVTEAHHEELLRASKLMGEISFDELKACGLNPEKLGINSGH